MYQLVVLATFLNPTVGGGIAIAQMTGPRYETADACHKAGKDTNFGFARDAKHDYQIAYVCHHAGK